MAASPLNYDTWFDYVRLEEAEGDATRVREVRETLFAQVCGISASAFDGAVLSCVFLYGQVYERAIANVPPVADKRYWRRYIYLWIGYALFEELAAQDMERTRAVYKSCLE